MDWSLLALQGADPVHVRDVLIVMGFLLSSGASAAAMIGTRRVQRREVRMSDEYVTVKQFGTFHTDVERRLGEQQESIRRIYQAIESLRRELMGLQDERGQRMHERMDHLEAEVNRRMQALPMEIVALLKNTGALGEK